jgi:methyltransferase-like protein
VTERPQASRLARYQAAFGNRVTSACHVPVELDVIAQHLVELLDGTRTHEQIARELAGIQGAPALQDIRQHLPGSLEWLASVGLLEG